MRARRSRCCRTLLCLLRPRAAARAGGARATAGAVGGAALLVTGCNDHVVRLWEVRGGGGEGEALRTIEVQLLGALSEHTARINSLAWPAEASVFSADGAGTIIHWEATATRGGGGGGGGDGSLTLMAKIEKKELRDVPINSITPHPTRKKRLLVQTRRSQLLALDHQRQHFATRYTGHRCTEYHIRAAYSPDGRFVVAGSEDGRFYAWDEDSGNLLFDGFGVGLSGPLLQVSWSATQHIVAMCGYGNDAPALLYYFSAAAAAETPMLAAAAAASNQAAFGADARAALGGSADGGLPLASAAAARPRPPARPRAVRRAARRRPSGWRIARDAGSRASSGAATSRRRRARPPSARPRPTARAARPTIWRSSRCRAG